ncbi:MAG: alpha/beta fold hydrolase, partial [bacterium]|nr:alpha/beta fold hydrolase [bacterium]
VFAAVVLLAVLALAWVWRNPLAVYEWTTRQELRQAGLERTEVELAGGRLVVWHGGEGPELVLLHGAGDQAGAWSKVVPGLIDDYRLLVVDLPGHGESDPAAGPLPFSTLTAGVEEFLDRREAGPETLVGHSMGAWLAMLYAHRHPERVARVVAVNGGPIRGEPSGVNLLPADREEARRTMAALRDPASPAIPDVVLDDVVRRTASGPLGRLMQDLDDMARHLLDGRLGELAVPVDLVWGESDRHLPVDYARRMENELERARLTTIPRCGHLPANECPERFLEILRRILAAGPPPAREP